MNIEPGMSPRENALRPFRARQLLADKVGQDFSGEEILEPQVVDARDLLEGTRFIYSALRHQEIEMGVGIDSVSEGLNGRNDSGHMRAPGRHLEMTTHGAESTMVKLRQQPVLVGEGDQEHLRNDEDDLAVADIEKECLSLPLASLLPPLRMTPRAKAAATAGQHQESLFMTVRKAAASKFAAQVAAIKIALDHLLDDGPEKNKTPSQSGPWIRLGTGRSNEKASDIKNRPLGMPSP